MDFDYLIIGAGISGAAAGYELACHGRTLIVDMEPQAGFHSTGRSAALYTPNYGPSLVRQINKLSLAFLKSPPVGFSANPLLSPRGMMTVAFKGFESELDALLVHGSEYLERLNVEKSMLLAPFLRRENLYASAYEKGVFDMDVSALHQGFLSGFKQRGGRLICNASVTSLSRNNRHWKVSAGGFNYNVDTVINAAGAWADEIGAMAKATKIGLQPARRTAVLVEAPPAVKLSEVPAIDVLGVDNYIKPEAQHLMVSPGDASPVNAHDVQADDLDVAKLIDWLERETSIEVQTIHHQWAGLRSFAPNGTPVVGFDPKVERFFWLAAQGGYGIMMAASLGRATASLLTDNRLPEDFVSAGVEPLALAVQ